ncbi:MAG: DUF503 domain-containing protein [Limnochordia bacterium]
MHIALLTLHLRINSSTSLKDKRRVLRSLLDRTKARFNVSVAEVDAADHLQNAVVAVVCVGSDARVVQGILESVAHLWETHSEAEVTRHQIDVL